MTLSKMNCLALAGIAALAFGSMTAQAVTVSYSHELAPVSTAGDILLGKPVTLSGGIFYCDPYNHPAVLNDGGFVDHGFVSGSPWYLTFNLGAATTGLSSVDVWIQDGDYSRWYLPGGLLSVSSNNSTWTDLTTFDNTVMVGTVTSPDAEINRIHIAFSAGEVSSFQYLRIAETIGGLGGSYGTPRLTEITAYLNEFPAPVGPTAVPEPLSAGLVSLASAALALAATRRSR